jgi:FRG domain
MRITNLGDFVSALSAKVGMADTTDGIPRIGRPFDRWYRGERDSSWKLQPKVFRDQKYSERDLTNRFRVLSKSRHSQLPDYNNFGLFLGLMQHYGLPTRLLDWSTSPLVALYFAVEKSIYDPQRTPSDASVWILNPYKLNLVEIDEATTPSIEGGSVRKFLRPAFSNYGPWQSHFRAQKDDYLELTADKVCAVMGAETDTRIFAQQGSFTIHTFKTPLQDHSRVNEFLDQLVIPAASVLTIAQEIHLCGFRRSTLFPDLASLAEDLETRHI